MIEEILTMLKDFIQVGIVFALGVTALVVAICFVSSLTPWRKP